MPEDGTVQPAKVVVVTVPEVAELRIVRALVGDYSSRSGLLVPSFVPPTALNPLCR